MDTLLYVLIVLVQESIPYPLDARIFASENEQ